MVVLTLADCAACCAVIWGSLVVLAAGRADRSGHDLPRPTPARPREEDLVRPALDASGAPIWVEQEDLFWHEIVCWPARRPAAADAHPARRSRRGA